MSGTLAIEAGDSHLVLGHRRRVDLGLVDGLCDRLDHVLGLGHDLVQRLDLRAESAFSPRLSRALNSPHAPSR